MEFPINIRFLEASGYSQIYSASADESEKNALLAHSPVNSILHSKRTVRYPASICSKKPELYSPVKITWILLESACYVLSERNIRASTSHSIHNRTHSRGIWNILHSASTQQPILSYGPVLFLRCLFKLENHIEDTLEPPSAAQRRGSFYSLRNSVVQVLMDASVLFPNVLSTLTPHDRLWFYECFPIPLDLSPVRPLTVAERFKTPLLGMIDLHIEIFQLLLDSLAPWSMSNEFQAISFDPLTKQFELGAAEDFWRYIACLSELQESGGIYCGYPASVVLLEEAPEGTNC
ncbi:hypothetical protein Tco_0500599 [Tanacetum coccineum]